MTASLLANCLAIDNAGIVTPASGDGGIDGIIKEDQLGFSKEKSVFETIQEKPPDSGGCCYICLISRRYLSSDRFSFVSSQLRSEDTLSAR